MKEHTLNHIGALIVISGIFLNPGFWEAVGTCAAAKEFINSIQQIRDMCETRGLLNCGKLMEVP